MAERFGAEITWLPYQLRPDTPEEGMPRPSRPGRSHALDMFEDAGLVYNPPPGWLPNTLAALRVTELAREGGLHDVVHDVLMRAYWEDAQDIGDRNVLRALVVEAGLVPEEVDEVLAGDAYRDLVLQLTAQAQSIGVTGIPSFLIDRKLLVPGAQPREVFERVFAQLD